MRVLQLSWEYPPAIVGGLGRHVDRLSHALAHRGVAVDVVTRGVPGERPAADDGDELLRVHRVPIPSFPAGLDAFLDWVADLNARLAARCAEVVTGDAFDLVHSHDWLVAAAARRTAHDAGLPWLVTVHATEHGRHRGHVARHPQSAIHAAERAMAADADHLITCSRYMADHVSEVLGVPRGQITALRNGVVGTAPHADDDMAERRARWAAPDERLMLLAGRLVHEKGFDLALDALRPILTARDEIRVIIAGTGPEEAQLRGQADRLRLDRRTRFLGWVDEATLRELYAVADVCLVPSRYEPFGIVALEAMSAGRPLIVADTGGLRELVPGDETAGLRVRPDDAGALSAAIERMLDDAGLRARCGAAARLRAREYEWPQVAGATRAVYARLLRRAPAVG